MGNRGGGFGRPQLLAAQPDVGQGQEFDQAMAEIEGIFVQPSQPELEQRAIESVGDGAAQEESLGQLARLFPEEADTFNKIVPEMAGGQSLAEGAGLPAFTDRLKLSFARTTGERKTFLENLGFEVETSKRSGELLVRRTKGEPFKKVDSDAFEFFNDLFADIGREVVEGGTAGVVQGLGTSGGALSPVPGGAIIGNRVGAFAGGALGTFVGDLIAENYAGIDRDVTRNSRVTEAMTMGAWDLAMGEVFRLGSAAIKGIAKKSGFGQKIAGDVIKEEAAQKQIGFLSKNLGEEKVALQAIDEADAAYRKGFDVYASDVLGVESAGIKKMIPELSEDPVMQARFLARKERLGLEFNKIRAQIGEVPDRDLTPDVSARLTSIEERIGQNVEAAKKLVANKFGDRHVNLSGTSERLDDIMTTQLGVDPSLFAGGAVKAGKATEVVAQLLQQNSALSKAKAREIVAQYQRLGMMARNTMESPTTISQVDRALKNLDSLGYSGAPGKTPDLAEQFFRQARGQLNQDRHAWLAEISEQAIKDGDKDAGEFLKGALEEYSGKIDSIRDFKKLLDRDPYAMATNFTPSKANRKNLLFVRDLMAREDPELWDSFRAKLFDDMFRRSLTGASQDSMGKLGMAGVGFNAKKFRGELERFGPDIFKDMFHDQWKNLDDTLKVSNLINRGTIKASNVMDQNGTRGWMTQLVSGLISPFRQARWNAVAKLIPNNTVQREFIEQGGLRKLVESVKDSRLKAEIAGATPQIEEFVRLFTTDKLGRIKAKDAIRKGIQDFPRSFAVSSMGSGVMDADEQTSPGDIPGL